MKRVWGLLRDSAGAAAVTVSGIRTLLASCSRYVMYYARAEVYHSRSNGVRRKENGSSVAAIKVEGWRWGRAVVPYDSRAVLKNI